MQSTTRLPRCCRECRPSRGVSCLSRSESRFTPPMACSIRMRMDEIARLATCASGEIVPAGIFFNSDDGSPWHIWPPWKPMSFNRDHCRMERVRTLQISQVCLVPAFPASGRSRSTCDRSHRSITRRVEIVWHVCLPLSESCWSSGSAGRWIGRSAYHHAKQGSGRDARGPFGGEPPRSNRQRLESWKPLLMGSCLMQNGMEAVIPTYSPAIATSPRAVWHLLNRILFHRP